MLNTGDNYRHQGMRRKLVEHLRNKGISDTAVLEAIGRVPRHLFIDDTAFLDKAYDDHAFPIPCGQTISQPYTVAFQSALLRLSKGMKVLEVGTGSGYQCAVLCELSVKVVSIERHKPLYLQTKQRMRDLGYRAALFHGDGYKGVDREAPFDRIVVTCGAPAVPQSLLAQLRIGGRAVIPVGEGAVQRMVVLDKQADGTCLEADNGAFRFVPMLADKA
jgi:protein-L-isoaspartate(D-aspartate) O-methyltransferase